MAKKSPPDLAAIEERIDSLVRQHGALPKDELRAVKRHLPALAERLRGRGFEVAANVRAPLAGQLLAQARGGFRTQKALEKTVAGATPREVKAALGELVARGELVTVVTMDGLGVVHPAAGSELVASADLTALLRRLTSLQKLVRTAISKRATVLREEVSPTPRAATGEEHLLGAIVALVARSDKPLRVPEVLRATGAAAEDGKRALLLGERRGLFGLQPESGMGRLSASDADACPRGPEGTVLSWIIPNLRRGTQS